MVLAILSLFYLSNTAAFAATADSVASLKMRAVTLGLQNEREWLLLGHWRKITTGYVSEVDGLKFFLSPNGKHDPLQELSATIDGFFTPSPGRPENEQAQCRFLARRDWLYERLSLDENEFPKLACREFTDWKLKLAAEGVSLVFASSYLGNAASAFGHTFIKFHSHGNASDRDLLNYGVNFYARTGGDGGGAFALYGLLGVYPGFFSLSPYHETLSSYLHLEGRDVWEYRLDLLPHEIERLLNHLLELQQTYFDYFFIDENCSYQILAALEVARPQLHLTDYFFYAVIPADTARLVTRIPGLVSGIRYRPSLATIFRASLEDLSSEELGLVKELVKAENVTPAQARLELISKARRAQILDSAVNFADLLVARTEDHEASQVLRDRDFRLKTIRAQTGVTLAAKDLTPLASRPEQGHDPARAGLGIGSRDGDGFSEFQFRLAYQNLLSSDTGYPPNSHLEAIRPTFRIYHSTGLQLQEFNILDIISIAPTDRFFHPLTWRFDTSLTHLRDLPNQAGLATTTNGGVGYASEPLRGLTLFSFLQGHGDLGPVLPLGYRLGMSLRGELLYRPRTWLRLNAGAEQRWYVEGTTSNFPSFWTAASLSVSRNVELRLDWSQVNGIIEQQAMLYLHFVL